VTQATPSKLNALLKSRAAAIGRLQEVAVDSTIGMSELEDLGGRIRHMDLAIAELRGQARTKTLILSGAIVAGTVSLLACARVQTTDVDATIEASAVELNLASASELSSISLLPPVSVSGISTVDVGGMTRSGQDLVIDSVQIDATRVRLEPLKLLAGSILGFQASRDDFELSLQSGSGLPRSLNLLTEGSGSLVLRDSTRSDAPKPMILSDVETIRISHMSADSPRARTVRVASHGTSTASFAPQGVQSVEFSLPSPPELTVARNESSILMARLRVGPKGSETTLSEGDSLILSGLRVATFRVGLCEARATQPNPQAACDRLYIRVVAKVGDVQVRRADGLVSLKQSWLEFLRDSSLIGLLWASALFIWGTGWSIWKAFVR
jgi:hypothetical protein